MFDIIYIIISALVCFFVVRLTENKLNKIDQAQFTSIRNIKTYEGKLLICGYMDENLPPQEIFDTSQLDEKGLMAIIYVNEDIEPTVYENALVGYDGEGICSVIVL